MVATGCVVLADERHVSQISCSSWTRMSCSDTHTSPGIPPSNLAAACALPKMTKWDMLARSPSLPHCIRPRKSSGTPSAGRRCGNRETYTAFAPACKAERYVARASSHQRSARESRRVSPKQRTTRRWCRQRDVADLIRWACQPNQHELAAETSGAHTLCMARAVRRRLW